MKKTSKIVTFLLMVMTIVCVASNVLAVEAPITPNEMTGEGNSNIGGIQSIGNEIIRILSTGGVVVSVIILIVLGIKYMIGSAEEKAEYKKTLMPYVIGAGLVFAASAIAMVVYNFASNIQIPGA